MGLRCNLTLTQTLAADRHSRETTRIGTVFRTRTETAVFDQNRIKPKPQYFIVRDTVFTRFLVGVIWPSTMSARAFRRPNDLVIDRLGR